MLLLLLLLLGLFGVVAGEYCSSVLKAPLPIDASDKELQLVTVVHRHGDRVPYMPCPINDGVEWHCDRTDLGVGDLLSQSTTTHVDRLFRRVFANRQNALRGNCLLGQLTSTGVEQHRTLGAAWRAKYVNLLRFLSPAFNATEMWLRSTDYERTLNSLQSNLFGLYPPQHARPGSVPVLNINTRDQAREYLLGGDSASACPKVVALLAALNATGIFNQVQANLDKIAAIAKQTLGIDADDLGTLRDNALARRCHMLPPYKGLTPELFSWLDANYTTRYYLKRHGAALQKFSIGPLFDKMIGIMKAKVAGTTPLKWLHFSGHDSTLVSVNAVLQRAPIWPPYASHVTFELWRSRTTASDYFVQVTADGAVVQPFGLKQSMLPLAQFEAQIQPILISQDDWRQQCMQ